MGDKMSTWNPSITATDHLSHKGKNVALQYRWLSPPSPRNQTYHQEQQDNQT